MKRRLEGTFPGELGIEVLETSTAGARGRLTAESRHLHPGGFVHGGVWVSLADTVAAWGTIPNLRPGHDFSTAEMKTNLFGVARAGD
ncbi:MAG: 1,4-dihydroxy-2-naphthoyl-CoA hydrolase, partial [Thermoleophilaceae bacterium]|nr:1,4-dihydroxy-2-naphthoyl-CoA hydrolase [Thermoleophilaceae bacterium]